MTPGGGFRPEKAICNAANGKSVINRSSPSRGLRFEYNQPMATAFGGRVFVAVMALGVVGESTSAQTSLRVAETALTVKAVGPPWASAPPDPLVVSLSANEGLDKSLNVTPVFTTSSDSIPLDPLKGVVSGTVKQFTLTLPGNVPAWKSKTSAVLVFVPPFGAPASAVPVTIERAPGWGLLPVVPFAFLALAALVAFFWLLTHLPKIRELEVKEGSLEVGYRQARWGDFLVGKPKWTFGGSFTTNLTSVTGLLSVTAGLAVVKDSTVLLSSDTYTIDALLLTGLAVIGGVLFTFGSRPLVKADAGTGIPTGTVVEEQAMQTRLSWLLVSTALLCGAVSGQMVLALMLLTDLWAATLVPLWMTLLLAVALIVVLGLAWGYAVRYVVAHVAANGYAVGPGAESLFSEVVSQAQNAVHSERFQPQRRRPEGEPAAPNQALLEFGTWLQRAERPVMVP